MLVRVPAAHAPDPGAVLAAFGLPGVVTAYDDVDGGWSNRVLRLTSTHGDHAVKELHNAWGEPRWREWLREAWRLELAARSVGVRMPEPVAAPDGGCVADVTPSDGADTVPVRLHHWVTAEQVPREPVTPDLGRWVGRTLASVHGLALRPLHPELYAGRPGLTTAEVWPDLVARSRASRAPWSDQLAAAEPLARRASALLVPWDPDDEVLCHGDVDQKNLLVASDGPLLCDWDVVLPRLPVHDLAEAALSMASWRSAQVAASVLEAYRDTVGPVDRCGPAPLMPTDLGPSLASRLGWICFTVDRALQARTAGTHLDGSVLVDVPELLRDLEHRVDVAERIEAWLG
jgi:Ser/Thr protein kinase RdoA (MazF antagonist)